MTSKPFLDEVSGEAHDLVDAALPGLISRRAAVKRTAGLSAGTVAALAMGSAPIALAALSREAGAQTASTVRQVLEFAFLLENLESEFYKAVLNTSTSAAFNAAFAPVRAQLAARSDAAVLQATLRTIAAHEAAHVNFLRTQLSTGGTAPTYTPASFDFTGGRGTGTGPFARATTDLQFLLLITQAVEDTGVRAYKGQVGNLMGAANATVLTAALGIHSIEARHAARIRRIRRTVNASIDAIRLSGTVRGGAAAAAGAPTAFTPALTAAETTAVTTALNNIYGGASSEANVTQGGTDLTALAANAGGVNGLTEAFDEPLTRAEVVAIVQPFVVANIS